MRKIILVICLVVLAGCGKKEPGGPDYDEYLPYIPTDDDVKQRESKIREALENHGYNDIAIAGILGNLCNENRTFDPTVIQNNSSNHSYTKWCENCREGGTASGNTVNNSGHAFGIVQWDGGRRSKLINRAGNSNNWYDLDTQIEYMLWELDKGYNEICGTSYMNSLKDESRSVVIATYTISANYQVNNGSKCQLCDKWHKGKEGYKAFMECRKKVNGCMCDSGLRERIIASYQYYGVSKEKAITSCHDNFCNEFLK
ncbi:MAG: phage tail-type lysozyme domain-containing protein [Lachnospiraceae bacterium]|jgi:hypothetical protein|nr:phage tail-type lysozyme domain-containing protein [Lachnospiraceae bacterium]